MKVKVCLDIKGYTQKPKDNVNIISNRIVKNQMDLEIAKLAELVGNQGYTFTPAIFYKPPREADNFKEMQVFALDFDGGITFEEVRARAEMYDFPISLAYETYNSSSENERFRVLFTHSIPVDNRKAAEIIIGFLMAAFPEADSQCRDVSRLFFGGKGVLYLDEKAHFNVVELCQNYECYLKATRKDYVQKMRSVAGRLGVAIKENGLFFIEKIDSAGNMELPHTIYMENSIIPEVYCIHLQSSNVQNTHPPASSKIADLNKPKMDQHLPELANRCRLYREFINGVDIQHKAKLLLATTLQYVNGGQSIFINTIKEYDPPREIKWRAEMWRIKKEGYLPMRCDGACPYHEDCPHHINILLTYRMKATIKRIAPDEEYESLETINTELKELVGQAMQSKGMGMHLIHAQTAAGKTSIYCDLISELAVGTVIVAVPTNKLKQQVYEDLKKRNVAVVYTPSLAEEDIDPELEKRIANLYSVGNEESLKEELRRYMKKNRKSKDPVKQRTIASCEKYCRFKWDTETSETCIVTTHQRLLHMPRAVIKRSIVIVDEDILHTIFRNTVSLQRSTLQRIRDSPESCPALKRRCREILEKKRGEYGRYAPIHDKTLIPLSALDLWNTDENVSAILKSSVYYIDEDCVTFFCPQELPLGKYIVLSATIYGDLYQAYFKKMQIFDYRSRNARYTGRVIQRTFYSLSRSSLKDKSKEIFEFVRSIENNIPIITFKEYGQMNDFDLHFGNTEGINDLKGRNIAVVGTPHNRIAVYNLISIALGGGVENHVTKREIVHNGYQFEFSTFENEMVQRIQLYLIESELEQCIGRARALREKVTVYVFSNFPCAQAELDQKNYLKAEYKDEDECFEE